MKRISAIGAGLLTLGLCAITHAQMGFRTPDMRGVWNPVVGAGFDPAEMIRRQGRP